MSFRVLIFTVNRGQAGFGQCHRDKVLRFLPPDVIDSCRFPVLNDGTASWGPCRAEKRGNGVCKQSRSKLFGACPVERGRCAHRKDIQPTTGSPKPFLNQFSAIVVLWSAAEYGRASYPTTAGNVTIANGSTATASLFA